MSLGIEFGKELDSCHIDTDVLGSVFVSFLDLLLCSALGPVEGDVLGEAKRTELISFGDATVTTQIVVIANAIITNFQKTLLLVLGLSSSAIAAAANVAADAANVATANVATVAVAASVVVVAVVGSTRTPNSIMLVADSFSLLDLLELDKLELEEEEVVVAPSGGVSSDKVNLRLGGTWSSSSSSSLLS
jgi:hypothetical protein